VDLWDGAADGDAMLCAWGNAVETHDEGRLARESSRGEGEGDLMQVKLHAMVMILCR